MDTLFSGRSIWTMVHGVFLGGGALMAIAAALFALFTMRPPASDHGDDASGRYLGWLLVLATVLVWLAVIVGTYVSFPPYRATPPDGVLELARYPRSLIRSNPETDWLHSIAMEMKEHMPWIAAMLCTAVTFVAVRYRSLLQRDAQVRRLAISTMAICFAIVATIGLLGIRINKVAPLE
jgi:heme A synthase